MTIDADTQEKIRSERSLLLNTEHQKTISDIFQLRETIYSVQQPPNSESKPRAQYDTLCDVRSLAILDNIISLHTSTNNTKLPTYVKAIIELQFLFGLRISEALAISPGSILFNGSIKIKGMKGSNDRIVFSVNYSTFWLQVREFNIDFTTSYNRFYFYRLYKKIGISGIMNFNANSSVTHYLRYMFVLKLLNDGENVNAIQQLIGHKSIKNTIHYLQNLNKNESEL